MDGMGCGGPTGIDSFLSGLAHSIVHIKTISKKCLKEEGSKNFKIT
jgi:hypothetical protein